MNTAIVTSLRAVAESANPLLSNEELDHLTARLVELIEATPGPAGASPKQAFDSALAALAGGAQ